MGKIPQVQKMLEYVIANNASYYIKYFKTKFDDQYAYTDYAFKVAPLDVALDYHQQLLASFRCVSLCISLSLSLSSLVHSY